MFFMIGLYDWGITKQKIAAFPVLLSAILSLMLFSFSWDVRYSSGGIELAALQSWESYAIAGFWAIIFFISVILAIIIYTDKTAKLLDEMGTL